MLYRCVPFKKYVTDWIPCNYQYDIPNVYIYTCSVWCISNPVKSIIKVLLKYFYYFVCGFLLLLFYYA